MKENLDKNIRTNIIIRSILFNLVFFVSTLLIALIGLPLAILSKKWAKYIGRFWGKATLWELRVICNLQYKVTGLENIPKDNCYILASKHESAWDTAFFLSDFQNPVYILKRELIFIPFFGLHLLLMGMIHINRSKGKKSIKEMCYKSDIMLNKHKRPIVIFPQGTRTAPNDRKPYKSGIYAIANNAKAPVIPVILNSGSFWGKSSFIKHPGTIRVKILAKIETGQQKSAFMDELKETMEFEYTNLKK